MGRYRRQLTAAMAPRSYTKTYKVPRRPFESARLDSELKVVGEYGLRNKREVWRVQLTLSKIHHARVLIRQRHIRVGKQIVNVPSFIVRLDSQKHIDFALTSPFGGGRP